jgi:ribonuclease P protein component
VVSKAVGGSVVRHAVVRRLRHLVRPRLAGLPPGARLVVRALPDAATASSARLGADLDAALERALRRARDTAGTGVSAG